MMKKFLRRFLGFLTGVAMLLALAEYCARICPNAYRLKAEWMQTHQAEVKTLVLGSSHAYAGIDASLLDGGYNLSNSNQTQRYDWLLLAQDSARLTSLQTLIYPASSLLMDYPLESTPEWYRCIYYQLYQGLQVHGWYTKYNWEVASIQTCCWKVQSLLLSGEADRMCDDLGRCTYYRADASNYLNLTPDKLADRLSKYQLRAAVRSDVERYFDRIADYCQRHKIRLLLVGTPVSRLYAESPLGKALLNEIAQDAQAAVQRYSCITYLDYAIDNRFSEADFFDVDHLNANGAQKLSLLLKEELAH